MKESNRRINNNNWILQYPTLSNCIELDRRSTVENLKNSIIQVDIKDIYKTLNLTVNIVF